MPHAIDPAVRGPAWRRAGTALALLLLFGLSTVFWAPTLFFDQTIFHGETARFGLPLMAVQPNLFEADNAVLWSNRISGGHPLFAEAQGAYANPVRYLLAEALPPVLAYNTYHWICTWLAGLGMFFLCRYLGQGRTAATFSSLAATFSSSWIICHANHVTIGTVAWVPWFLLAAEHWWRSASVRSPAGLAVAAALLVVSGYPQIAYGAALYFIITLVPELLYRARRQQLLQRLAPLAASGALAVLLGTGLAAIQLLPLVELSQESHRAGGVPLVFPTNLERVLRGLLFTWFSGDRFSVLKIYSLGSLLVCTLAVAALFGRKPPRLAGHLLAAFVLLNLGMQNASPLFRLAYEYHLIPGLRSFRIMYYFVPVAVAGACLCAGFALQGLSSLAPRGRVDWRQWLPRLVPLLGVGLALLLLSRGVSPDDVSPRDYFAILLLLTGVPLLFLLGWQRHVTAFAVALLLIELGLLRMAPFQFLPVSEVREPANAAIIRAEADAGQFKSMDMTRAPLHVLKSPQFVKLQDSYRVMRDALSPMQNLMWGIHSIDAALSLTLGRRQLLEEPLRAEARGESGTAPGHRLLDILSVRYITYERRIDVGGLELASPAGTPGVRLYRNAFARPFAQLYEEAEARTGPEAALNRLLSGPTAALQVEAVSLPPFTPTGAAGEPGLELLALGAGRYEIQVDSPRHVWLFVADANYPGWTATVNGAAAAVYSAQVLGKAVFLPPGASHVVLEFRSLSYRWGLTLSALSGLILCTIVFWRRRQPGPPGG